MQSIHSLGVLWIYIVACWHFCFPNELIPAVCLITLEHWDGVFRVLLKMTPKCLSWEATANVYIIQISCFSYHFISKLVTPVKSLCCCFFFFFLPVDSCFNYYWRTDAFWWYWVTQIPNQSSIFPHLKSGHWPLHFVFASLTSLQAIRGPSMLSHHTNLLAAVRWFEILQNSPGDMICWQHIPCQKLPHGNTTVIWALLYRET